MRLIITTAITLFAAHAFAANGAMKGDGSAENPFQIEDYEDLKAIGKDAYLYSSNYILTKDIDASASKNENCKNDECSGFTPIGRNKDAVDSTKVRGTFDGQNHTIRNLFVQGKVNNLGLFSNLYGSVKNLKLDSANIMGAINSAVYVGSVVGHAEGPIENVHVTNSFVRGFGSVGGIVGTIARDSMVNVSYQGEVNGIYRIGGIVGLSYARIVNASADIRIVAKRDSSSKLSSKQIGGIAGYAESGIRNSHSSGVIIPNALHIGSVGGLVGESRSTILNCFSSVDLLSVSDSGKTFVFDDRIGGLVGDNRDPIIYAYATGNVEGTSSVGGLVGTNSYEIWRVYAQGTVKGEEYVGGLVGHNTTVSYGNLENFGVIHESYAGNKVVGNENVGGLVGYNRVEAERIKDSYWDKELSGLDSSDGGTGLSTKEMMTMSSFVGWDTLGGWNYAICDKKECAGYDTLDNCLCRYKFFPIWGIDEGKSYPYFIKYDSAGMYDPEAYNGVVYTNPQNPVHIQNQTLAKSHSFGAKFQGGNIDVRFEIPAAGSVKFSLVDMQGHVVKSADLGHRATGSHFETLDAAKIARGRYIGFLQVGGKAVEKTVLLKK